MNDDLKKLAAEIDAMSPANRLRVAADLLEAQQPKIAYRLIDRVYLELGAAMTLADMDRRRGQG
ncbi:MAG TPA: hypothetical protein PLZ93_21360 [Nocardioides sp.]|nr:hypothetical protein [Nocardioides sp.]